MANEVPLDLRTGRQNLKRKRESFDMDSTEALSAQPLNAYPIPWPMNHHCPLQPVSHRDTRKPRESPKLNAVSLPCSHQLPVSIRYSLETKVICFQGKYSATGLHPTASDLSFQISETRRAPKSLFINRHKENIKI